MTAWEDPIAQAAWEDRKKKMIERAAQPKQKSRKRGKRPTGYSHVEFLPPLNTHQTTHSKKQIAEAKLAAADARRGVNQNPKLSPQQKAALRVLQKSAREAAARPDNLHDGYQLRK